MPNRDTLTEPHRPPLPFHDPTWGTTVLIKGTGCDRARAADPAHVAGFLSALVAAAGMKAYGDPEVVEFGEGDLHGLSAKQWIYTSSVMWFAVWHNGGDGAPADARLDLWTCGPIVPEVAARVHQEWFGGQAAIRAVVEW